MKRILIFLAVIILLFVGIAMITSMQQSKKAEGNPYGKDKLHPETIQLLENPNYNNLILPEQLKEKLNNQTDITVYFFSPTCDYCMDTTPVVRPIAEDLGIDLVQYNLLEFEQGWREFQLESIPTIVHFKNGEEFARINGFHEGGTFKAWFEDYVLE